MKSSTELETERLILRPWTLSDEDRAFFHFILSDAEVRHFYPSRLSRNEADEKLEEAVASHGNTDVDWGVACLKSNGEPVGTTGLAHVNYELPFTPCVEIGWLYHPKVWGQGLATEAGNALIQQGFEDVGLEEIVAFAVQDNHPSIAVMERIGMKRVIDGDFDHPGVPDSHAHLKRHVLYKISADQWRDQAQTA
ncbi:MAG: GNAT family N-acetyltransferase [Rhizobiaceae bacterium]